MTNINRRSFLTFAGLAPSARSALASRGGACNMQARRPFRRQVLAPLSSPCPPPVSSSGYTKLTAGPGWANIVRSELAEPKSGREDRRTALASLVQLTDVHIVDASPPHAI